MKDLKRYLIFIGEDYYPKMGFGDFAESMDDVSDCESFILDFVREKKVSYSWAQIVDGKTGEILKTINSLEKFVKENEHTVNLKLNKKVIKI